MALRPLVIACGTSLCMGLGGVQSSIAAQETAAVGNQANWEQLEKFSSDNLERFVYTSAIPENWINETDSLWYRWEDGDGVRFQLVLPGSPRKQPLFDHQLMANKLSEALREPVDVNQIPIRGLEFQEDGVTIHFEADSTRFAFNLQTTNLSELPDEEDEDQGRDWRAFSPDSTAYAFARDHNLFIVDVASGDTIQLSNDGEEEYSFGAADEDDGEEEEEEVESDIPPANGKVRPGVRWSEDSQGFYVQRRDSREVNELYLVDVLADPRPTLREYNYAMPGEEHVPQTELHLYMRGDTELAQLPVDKWKDQTLGNIHWTIGSDVLRLTRKDRLRWNLELIEVDTETKDVEVLIRESIEEVSLERNIGVEYVEAGGDILWWSERTGWAHYYLYDHDGNFKHALTSGNWVAEDVVAIDSIGGEVYISGVGREPGENLYHSHLYKVDLATSNITLLDPGDTNHSSSVSPSFRYVLDVHSSVEEPGRAVLRSTDGDLVLDLESMDTSDLEEYGFVPPESFTVKAADGITPIHGVMWKPFDFDAEKKYPIIASVYPGPQTEGVGSSFQPTSRQQALAQLGFVVIQIGNRGGTPRRSNAYQAHSYYDMRDYGLADKKAGIEQLAARHPFIDVERVGIYGHSGGGFMTAAALLREPYNEFFTAGVSSAGNHDNNVYNQSWGENFHGLKMMFSPKAEGGSNVDGDGSDAPTERAAPITDQEVIAELYERHIEEGDSGIEEEYDIWFDIQVDANHEIADGLKNHLLLVHGNMDNNVHPAGTIRLVNALIDANKRFDLMILPGQAHGFGPRQGYFNRMLQEYFAEHLLGDYYKGEADIGE